MNKGTETQGVFQIAGDKQRPSAPMMEPAKQAGLDVPQDVQESEKEQADADAMVQAHHNHGSDGIATISSGVIAPDRFQHGPREVNDLTSLEWRLLEIVCAGGKLREAVPMSEVIGHVYQIDPKARNQIGKKERAVLELRRRLQRKLDGAEMRLLFTLTNGFLALQAT